MANEGQSRTARRSQLKKQQKKQKKPIWKRIVLIIGLLVLLAGLGVGGLFTYYISKAPEINPELLSDPASTKVYDMNEELFADLGTEKRTKIEYGDIPPILEDAVIATEDVRFFDHIGIDFKRIGGALLANVRDGYGAEGASTITQQVVRGSFLSKEKRLERKVQEQWLAIKLDAQYEKEEILEMYLNKIYYGAGAYGVAKAAETYFGKTDLSTLTLPEAALLAGLPQRPNGYDPFINPDLAQKRMNTVLHLMVLHDKISEEEAEEARNVPVESLLTDKRPNNTLYEAYIQKVADEIDQKLGINIYNEGLEIYTTLDQDAQQHVEFLLEDSENNPIAYPDDKFQAGLTVLDTKSGAIRAIGGGRNRENGGWNYAIQNERQPGSTFKPIIDYGPAIEYLNWSTYHQLNDDGSYPIAGTDKEVKNYNGRFQGWMTMRNALAHSINVPAMKTLEEVGLSNAQEFAENLGIEFEEDGIQPTDAIGGAQTGVSALELAGAYRAFGNEGIYNEPYAVTKVVYSDDGRTVELKPEPRVVMSEYTAYMVTDMLQSVISYGSGQSANVPSLPMAGKTGTTNRGENTVPDIWFSGYTTNYTIAVWTGYDDVNTSIPQGARGIAKDLFRETMQKVSEGMDTSDFVQPNSVVEVTVEKGTNPAMLPSEYTPDSEKITELFVRGHEPSEISEKYDRVAPVKELKAEYDQENQVINVQWDYEMDEDKPVSFEISVGTENNELSELTTIKETQLEIANIEFDTNYTIQVIAVSDENTDNVSDPVTTKVQIPKNEPEVNDDENENEGENNGDDANNNDNGNGNGGENGNENGNGNGQNNGENGSGNEPGNDNDDTNEDDENPNEDQPVNGDDPVDGLGPDLGLKEPFIVQPWNNRNKISV